MAWGTQSTPVRVSYDNDNDNDPVPLYKRIFKIVLLSNI